METENTKSQVDKNLYGESRKSMSGRIFGGLIVLTVGLILLARKMDVAIPSWLISWELLIIAIGFYIGFRHSFKGGAWIIIVLVGALFLIDDIDPTLSLNEYVWPIIIIAIGLIMIFRPQKKILKPFEMKEDNVSTNEPAVGDDYIDNVSVFGGFKRNIFSKTFRGGEMVTVFGGAEVNLLHADITHTIELDITQIFGGTKIIVPAHWRVQSEDFVSFFGALEDKRPIMPNTGNEPLKIIKIKGINIFGGVDIKSF